MAEEQKTSKVDVETPVNEPPSAPVEVYKDVVAEEKIHESPPPPVESKALAIVEHVILANLENEKKYSFIKAWEESEKSKAENKAQKKISDVLAWENSKKAAIEAQLRKIEEKIEKKKSEYGEKMKNKMALIHKEAEEKRAIVESKKGEDLLKAQELAAKYKATGIVPKATCGCF